MTDTPRATVREVDGQLVLDDPDALAVALAVSKANCAAIVRAHGERVNHFVSRIVESGHSAKDVVIVLVNVDDVHGGPLADVLMPGHDWQAYRARGEVPFARGLARRDGMQEALALFDEQAAEKLRTHEGVAIVVVDFGVAEVFAPEASA